MIHPATIPCLFLLVLCLLLPAGGQAQLSTTTRETTPQEEIVYRVQAGKAADVKLLLKKVGTPNITDRMGWPLLAIAASRTDDEGMRIAKMLIENGADVNYHGGTQNYPLMFAVQAGNEKMVKYLLDQGADYRVSDTHGMKIVDFARASLDHEVMALINQAVEDDVYNLTHKRSQDYLNKITYDLAYHSCALQYYGFYYKSGQDVVPVSVQNATMEKHKTVVGRSIAELMMLFRVPHESAMEVFEAGRKAMYAEMENLISNRWRRIKGVGQPGDMEERCDRLSAYFKEKHFDKEKLDKLL